MNYDKEFEKFFGQNTKKMINAVSHPNFYANEKYMMKLAWNAALKLKQQEIEKLIESNCRLSEIAAEYIHTSGHIHHIFGKPLKEVYQIILEHEKRDG